MTLPATLLQPTLESEVPASPKQTHQTEIKYQLVCLEGPSSIEFTPSTDVGIGRDPKTCQLVLAECASVSRVHCKLFSMGREVFVNDFSSNGTFVNGKVVGKGNKRALRAGDIIAVVNPELPESQRYSWRFIPPKEEENGLGSNSVEEVYELGKVLGTGNFATVRLGKHKVSGQQVAVKIIEKKRFALAQSDFSFDALQSEVEILRKMKHKNIISVLDVFDDPKTFTLVLELVSGGDFFDYIVGRSPSPFTEEEARKLFVQLLEAMLYMHSKNVVHRDLKPENILVQIDPMFTVPHKCDEPSRNAKSIPPSKVTLKITDFGLAKFCSEHEVMTTMCGTPSYLAPEVLNADDSKGGKKAVGYSWSVDVWSLGVILYIALSGCPPKDPQKGNILFNKYMSHISNEAKSLIVAMLTVNPMQRAHLEDICNHPWLKGVPIEGKELAEKVTEKLTLAGTVMFQPQTECAASDQRISVPAAAAQATDDEDSGPSDLRGSEVKKSRSETLSSGAQSHEPTTTPLIVWFWKKELHLPDNDPMAWQRYSDEDCVRIEKSKVRGMKSCKVGHTSDYRISFEGDFQYNTKDPTKQRPVKRAVL